MPYFLAIFLYFSGKLSPCPRVVHGATEVGPHGQHPEQHRQVVDQDEDPEALTVDCQEHTEHQHSARQTKQPPQPLGRYYLMNFIPENC